MFFFTECKRNEFACNNGKCITEAQKCNQRDDCGDGSDEEGCGNFQFQLYCDIQNIVFLLVCFVLSLFIKKIYTDLEECVWEWSEGECSKSCGGGIRKDRIGLRSGSSKCYENFNGRREKFVFCNTKKCNIQSFGSLGTCLIYVKIEY